MKTIVLLCILGIAVAFEGVPNSAGIVRHDVESQTHEQVPQTTQTTPVSQIPVFTQVETQVPYHEIKKESHHFFQYPISQYPTTQYQYPTSQYPVSYQYPMSYQYPIESQVDQLYSKLISLFKHFPYLFPQMQHEYPVDMYKGHSYFQYPYYKQYEGSYEYPYYKQMGSQYTYPYTQYKYPYYKQTGSQYTYPYAQYEYPKQIPYYPEYSQVLRTPYVHEQLPVVDKV